MYCTLMRAQLENLPFRKLVSAHQSGGQTVACCMFILLWISMIHRSHRRLLLELVLGDPEDASRTALLPIVLIVPSMYLLWYYSES